MYFQGLTCLDDNVQSVMNDKQTSQEQPKAFHNPNIAIPLRYEPLSSRASNSTNKTSDPESGDHSATNQNCLWKSGILPQSSWHVLSKVLLLKKAAIAYQGLAEVKVKSKEYDQVKHYVKLGLRCFGELLNWGLVLEVHH